jgi:glycosyltransferase involved in cell wall biosynthesis
VRVLLVTHSYPPFVGGVERVSEQTATSLSAAGHHVTVLTRRQSAAPPAPRLERATRDGVDVLMISGGGSAPERFPGLAARLERLFERTLLEINPDVVLLSHLMHHSPGYVSIAHRWGVPVVVELHDFYVACERIRLQRLSGELCGGPEGGRACAAHCFGGPDAAGRWGLRTQMFRHAVEHADAVICPSRFVADYFQGLLQLRCPTHVIGNGVEAADAPAGEKRPGGGPLHLACVGVVVEFKGQHIVLEALRLAKLPSARLTLFGAVNHPYFGELLLSADAIENLGFRSFGIFDPSDLPMLLADVDVVIIPSLVWESYSIAAREAMACGIPVIASRLGALPEAVEHGRNGLLFEPGSAAELAGLLQMLDGDRDRLAALGTGIRRSDWISVGQRTTQLLAVLEQAIAVRESKAGAASGEEGLLVVREAFLERASATSA